MSYKIITDVTTDLSQTMLDGIGVTAIPMPVLIDGAEAEHFADCRNFSISEFYSKLRQGAMASTAQINVESYINSFEPLLKQGQDIVYICFSSGLSGSIQSANIAIAELAEKYPQQKIYCVDSLCACAGEGLLVYAATKKREQGFSAQQLAQWLEDNKLNLCHWFTVDDLKFLHRGGRVSKAASIAGSVLSIKPVMHVDNAGKLVLVSKARGQKKAYQAIIDKMKKTATDLKSQTLFIAHGDYADGANMLADMIKEQTDATDIRFFEIGPVIGAHSGPATMALFFFGTER